MVDLLLELVSTFNEKEVPCLWQCELATKSLVIEIVNETTRRIMWYGHIDAQHV